MFVSGFATAFTNSMHRNLRTDRTVTTYPCPNFCGRKYKYKSTLYVHLKYECGVDKQFKCDDCGKFFARKAHLQSHTANIHKRLLWLPSDVYIIFYMASSRRGGGKKPWLWNFGSKILLIDSKFEQVISGVSVVQDVHSLHSLRRHQSNCEGTKEKIRAFKKKLVLQRKN